MIKSMRRTEICGSISVTKIPRGAAEIFRTIGENKIVGGVGAGHFVNHKAGRWSRSLFLFLTGCKCKSYYDCQVNNTFHNNILGQYRDFLLPYNLPVKNC